MDVCPRLLPADIAATFAHALDQVSVPDGSSHERQRQLLEVPLQAEIGHDGGNERVSAKKLRISPGTSDQRHQLIAIEQLAAFIDSNDAVGITIEGKAESCVRLAHGIPPRARTESAP